MPSSQEPRNSLYQDWDEGQGGWKDQMDANLLKIGAFLGLSIIDRDLTTPPGSPADGDAYIPATTATGAWATHEDEIAIWRDSLSAWEFYDPSASRSRPSCFIEDENRLVVWNGANWNLGVTLT